MLQHYVDHSFLDIFLKSDNWLNLTFTKKKTGNFLHLI